MSDLVAIICTDQNDACQNGGVCITWENDPSNNYCDCPANTAGGRCHQVLAPKDMSVCTVGGTECLNGGNCIASTQTVDKETEQTVEANYCDCPLGTYGDVCHNNPPKDTEPTGLSVCTVEGKQCLNGGACVPSTEIVDGKSVPANKCVCPLDTFGDVCHNQEQKDEIAADAAAEAAAAATEAAEAEDFVASQSKPICTENGNECQNGGYCKLKDADKNIPENYCVCPETHHGDRCHGTFPGGSSFEDTHTGSGSTSGSKDGMNPETNPVCTKDGKECQNGATCHPQDMENNIPAAYCKCTKGFFGDTCTHAACTEKGMECHNGGVCVLASNQNDMSAENYCSCPEGTSGKRCEKVDNCSIECENGSSCRHHDDITHANDSGDDDYCECVGNFKGLKCSVPFETCPTTAEGDEMECLWGGKCVLNKDKQYDCDCPKGRYGVHCEFGEVSTIEDWNGDCNNDNDCQNNGLCIKSHDSASTEETGMKTTLNQCLCPLGFGGNNCEQRCKSLNCQHGSSCRFPDEKDISHANDTPEFGAFCDCMGLPFKGKECEIAMVKCPDGLECLYGGTCVGSEEDTDGDFYNCACPPGRKGLQCEMDDPKFYGNSSSQSGKPTLNQTPLEADLNIFVVSVVVVIILALFPVTIYFLKRNKDRKASAANAASANECLEGIEDISAVTSETDSRTNGGESNGHSNGDVHPDDVFDYDTDGVVNVSLDENEPVPLDKDKQIV